MLGQEENFLGTASLGVTSCVQLGEPERVFWHF